MAIPGARFSAFRSSCLGRVGCFAASKRSPLFLGDEVWALANSIASPTMANSTTATASAVAKSLALFSSSSMTPHTPLDQVCVCVCVCFLLPFFWNYHHHRYIVHAHNCHYFYHINHHHHSEVLLVMSSIFQLIPIPLLSLNSGSFILSFYCLFSFLFCNLLFIGIFLWLFGKSYLIGNWLYSSKIYAASFLVT